MYDNVTSLPVKTPKSYGYSLRTPDLLEGIARFFPLAPSNTRSLDDMLSTVTNGLPRHLLIPVLAGIRDEVLALRVAFDQVHLRMVGGSVLIVYEADWERAEEGVTLLEARNRESHTLEVDFKQETGEDVGGGGDDLEDDDDASDDIEDDDDDAEDDDEGKIGLPFVVRLIDFAHTRITPGQGPDQGVLLGLDTLSKLLSGRIEQVQNATI